MGWSMSVAEQLRQAREAKKLTVEQVAEFTKVRADHVRAVEAGDYTVFTASVYLRGFIRTYSSLLKLEAPKILADLDAELGEAARRVDELAPERPSQGLLDLLTLQFSKLNLRKTVILLSIAAGLLLIVVAVFAWHHYRTTDPLRDLKPGIYQKGRPLPGEKLPLPPPPKK